MQHLEPRAQAAAKQRVLEDAFWHIGRLRPDVVFRAIHGPDWGYRFRARLSVRLVPRKGGVLVGFHERKSSYVADMSTCPVLPDAISALLPALRRLVESLSIPDRLPQIEVAVGTDAQVLVFRHLEPLTESDLSSLTRFGAEHGLHIYLQPRGPDSAHRLHPVEAPPLAYRLPEFGVRLHFLPTDFIQVNQAVNAALVSRAVALLDPRPGERIADLFCGLGNFTLPIASRGADVVGLEGNPALLRRAAGNAAINGLQERVRYAEADLFEIDSAGLASYGRFDKLLIDPPREGALALVRALGESAPERIVYVSCNPATLARDAAVLVHEKGYRLAGAGIANMFPHTSHVESVALFEHRAGGETAGASG